MEVVLPVAVGLSWSMAVTGVGAVTVGAVGAVVTNTDTVSVMIAVIGATVVTAAAGVSCVST